MASRSTGASRRTPSAMEAGGTALKARRSLLEGSSEWVNAAPGIKTTPASIAFCSNGYVSTPSGKRDPDKEAALGPGPAQPFRHVLPQARQAWPGSVPRRARGRFRSGRASRSHAGRPKPASGSGSAGRGPLPRMPDSSGAAGAPAPGPSRSSDPGAKILENEPM